MLSGPTFWITIAAATLATGSFAFLEWRRPDRRHLAARLAATLGAVAALTLLGLSPTRPFTSPSPGGIHAVLWTPLAAAAVLAVPAGIDAGHRFALPDAIRLDPAAQPVPDAAFLRRRHPEIGTVRLLGDGLDPSELDALRGLRVEFDPPNPSTSPPGIRFIRCPRELPLGDPLIVQGRLGNLAPRTSVTLTLEAPDGATVNTATLPADATGETPFALQTASPPAAGHFLWHLRLPASAGHPARDLPLGVAVIPPDLPRVLVLESAPRFDTAALRHWFETAGGTLAARTQVGQDRYRYASAAASAPPDFTTLDARFLTGFDLLLADTRSLLTLSPAEREALLAAVADTGLGLLLFSDDAPPPAGSTPLFPWKLSSLAADPPGSDRPARLQWPGQSAPTDLPIPTAPLEILPADAQRPLLGDRQGHTLAAAVAHGRGQLGLTLVRDTTRWQRANDPAAFAAYWSLLFSRLARPAEVPAGRWSLPDGDAGPVFADHPLELLWSGLAAHPPGPAVVATLPATRSATLALASDPSEPGRWRGTFWPRGPGWHRVSLGAGGPVLDFYVSAADAWPALAAERRRTATARFAAISDSSGSPATPLATHRDFPPVWLAALFFLSAGYLWIERRLTR